MKEKLKELQELALKQIETAVKSSELEEIRVKFLGKKGELTTILRSNFQQNKNPERKHSFLCFLSGF